MGASDKGSYIDKAVPRFVKQILVSVTDGAGFLQRDDTALPGGNSADCESIYHCYEHGKQRDHRSDRPPLGL
jgi:hypothetical protein